MRHAPLIRLAALCVAAAAAGGCASTAAPRYVLLQYEHTWRAPDRYEDTIAALPTRQAPMVVHGAVHTPALVAEGSARHRVVLCRQVDLEGGTWAEVHCDEAKRRADVTVRPVSFRDEQRRAGERFCNDQQ